MADHGWICCPIPLVSLALPLPSWKLASCLTSYIFHDILGLHAKTKFVLARHALLSTSGAFVILLISDYSRHLAASGGCFFPHF
jgi:hypothetical protein